MKTAILPLLFILFFLGCVDKTYIYSSTISDANLSSFLSKKMKGKESLYQIETTLNATYFFSIEEAKEKLSTELLKNIKKLCKKEKKRYFAIITPKELSNTNNTSLVTTKKEFIQKIQRESFYKNEQQNHTSIRVNFLLLKKKPLEYLVWDSQNY